MKSKESDKKGTNFYDRILRENAEQIFMPLIKQYLDFEIKISEPITEKLTTTIERETDFLYKITTVKNQKLLLHIEFQSKNDSKMLLRMAEYHGLILKKYRLPIRHIVVYLGKAKVNMPNRLPENEIFTGFDLISINELEAEQFLSAQLPELILMAFLSKYKKEETEQILKTVVEQLKAKASSEAELTKYVNQLILLTRMRKLDNLTLKILEDMPLTIDIKKDLLYQKGVESERRNTEIAIQNAEVARQKIVKSITNLFERGFSVEHIAPIFEISIEEVKEILNAKK